MTTGLTPGVLFQFPKQNGNDPNQVCMAFLHLTAVGTMSRTGTELWTRYQGLTWQRHTQVH